jgi:hypothetical protein
MRKRRLFIAAAAVLGVAWFSWPRGDARFVGTWQCIDETARLELRSDGFARLGTLRTCVVAATNRKFTEVTVPGTAYMRWRVEGDRLVLGEPSGPSKIMAALSSLAEIVDIDLVADDGDEYMIVDVKPDELRLKYVGDENEVTFRRVTSQAQ